VGRRVKTNNAPPTSFFELLPRWRLGTVEISNSSDRWCLGGRYLPIHTSKALNNTHTRLYKYSVITIIYMYCTRTITYIIYYVCIHTYMSVYNIIYIWYRCRSPCHKSPDRKLIKTGSWHDPPRSTDPIVHGRACVCTMITRVCVYGVRARAVDKLRRGGERGQETVQNII